MGVKERKEREKQRRAGEILEAAYDLFESRGFISTTLQDVANAAEISVGLIYRYFQSKEDIFASLALKGAEDFDTSMKEVLKNAESGNIPGNEVLFQIAKQFFDFYGPYGEYFDLMMYSVKGRKDVQIRATTVTQLMAVTISTLTKLKDFIASEPTFLAQDEDDALQVVFLLWGILLGCHKLFDRAGRGHIFTYSQDDFLRNMIDQVMTGISAKDLAQKLPPLFNQAKKNRSHEVSQTCSDS